MSNTRVGVDVGHFGHNRSFRTPILPVARLYFRQRHEHARRGDYVVFGARLAVAMALGNDNILAEIRLADPHDMAEAPADEPAFQFGRVAFRFQVPMFGQHLAGQDKQVQHHVSVFDVVDEDVGGQAQLW